MRRYAVTHFYHSGFSVSCGDTILVFDYWRGENGELAENLQLTPEILGAYSHIIVFISHDHPDHMDPVVFTWKDVPGLQYVIASDMPAGTPGLRLAPGDSEELPGDVKVTAFDSTDLGVSFLVDFRGLSVFHAGDLNFWHWREESTMKEIEEADREFRKAVAPICGKAVDLAFFPVDPRQGPLFESGANYFILAVKTPDPGAHALFQPAGIGRGIRPHRHLPHHGGHRHARQRGRAADGRGRAGLPEPFHSEATGGAVGAGTRRAGGPLCPGGFAFSGVHLGIPGPGRLA